MQTREVTRGKDGEESKSLEVIDLGSELGTRTRTSRPGRTRSRSGWAVLAVVIACVSALGVALAVGTRGGTHAARRPADTSTSHSSATGSATLPSSETLPPTRQTVPTSRPRGPIPGRFYPVLDQTDTTTLVLPSGLEVTLSGGLTKTIGGLGASFGGSVSPKDSAVWHSVNFEVDHGAPSDLFNTLGPDAVTTPVLVSAAHAKQDDLKQGLGQYAILSTGDWTLVAHYGDAAILKRVDSWRLRSTPYGAVLEVPADSTIDYSGVLLGRVPDLSERQVELTENSCPPNADTARRITPDDSGDGGVGYWCAQGLWVRIQGPLSYVDRVVAGLKVNVEPGA